DYENPDYKGNPTYKPRKPKTFEELAFDHRVSSPATADSNYRKALNKMKKKLLETGYDFKEKELKLCPTLMTFTHSK
ncbi:MAG: hypothetical protein IKJ59_00270, partial [Clostridia bacterium]|nr:hypothetical protein [Clostridia bacterium]